MTMIDVYATAGTFTDKHQLAADLSAGPDGHREGPGRPHVPP
jgi:hypothetical protein